MIKMLFIVILNGILASGFSSAQGKAPDKPEIEVVINEKPAKAGSVFQFKAYPKDSYLRDISSEMSGSHPFGDLVSKKLYLFEEHYTSEENPFPGNPAVKTVIKKPLIYEAVLNIERDLRKSVRKNEITIDNARSVMDFVLDVALNILSANTEEFETELKATPDVKAKTELFTKRVTLKY